MNQALVNQASKLVFEGMDWNFGLVDHSLGLVQQSETELFQDSRIKDWVTKALRWSTTVEQWNYPALQTLRLALTNEDKFWSF